MKVSYVFGYTQIDMEDDLGTTVSCGKDRVTISQDSDEPRGCESIQLTKDLVKLIQEIQLK